MSFFFLRNKELFQANWSFKLQHEANQSSGFQVWDHAITNVMNSKELIWVDKDKKGRHRQRDFKPELKNLCIKK